MREAWQGVGDDQAATALRTRPELADALRDVLQKQHDGIAQRDTDVLQTIFERLEHGQEFSRRIMAFAEDINDRMKALEQSAGTHEETGAANGPQYRLYAIPHQELT
jgi:hypothetical protein